jgi:hypothetical protein
VSIARTHTPQHQARAIDNPSPPSFPPSRAQAENELITIIPSIKMERLNFVTVREGGSERREETR